MGTALRRGDVIDKAVNALIVGIIVLHGHFHINVALFPFTVNDIRVQHLFLFIQIFHILLDTALIVEGQGDRLLFPQICEDDLKIPRQKCHLPEALF